MESLIIPLKIYVFAMVFSYLMKVLAEKTVGAKELLSWMVEGNNAYITSITVLQGIGLVAEKIGILYFIFELARL